MNQIKCELCDKWLNVTTIRSLSQKGFNQSVRIPDHKCEKLISTRGSNCKYCNKHVNLKEFEIYNKEFGYIQDYRFELEDHQCVNDDLKCEIDMELSIDAHDKACKAYFDSLNI